MPSILDVARQANVAPSTVSLVVNGRRNVSAETRRRVQSVIEALGYVPGRQRRRRRAAARRQTRHVAIVYTQGAARNGAMTRLCRSWIRGIRQALGPHGAHPSVVAGMDRVDRDLMFQQMLEAGEFDGVVLFGAGAHNGYLERVLEANVPLVVMNRDPQYADVCSVAVDFHGGGRQAGEWLLGLGHRRLALIEGEHEPWTAQQSHAGFQQALRAAGVEPVVLPREHESGGDAASIVQRLCDAKVTGVFVGDHMAIQLVNELERQGVDVPGRVSVVGFDNLGFVSDAGKRLSSIGHPKVRMGRLAGRLLLQLLSPTRRLHRATLVLPTHVVAGETVRPVGS